MIFMQAFCKTYSGFRMEKAGFVSFDIVLGVSNTCKVILKAF